MFRLNLTLVLFVFAVPLVVPTSVKKLFKINANLQSFDELYRQLTQPAPPATPSGITVNFPGRGYLMVSVKLFCTGALKESVTLIGSVTWTVKL